MNDSTKLVNAYPIVCLYTIAIIALGFIIGAKTNKADSHKEYSAPDLSEW